MMDIAVLGIDLGKNSCSVAGLDEAGRVVLRRRVSRDGLAGLFAKLRPCTVAMEACCGAHHVSRSATVQGHQVRLMPPEYVRPYVKAQKNDDRDAEAIAEAATRPTMRFVPVKEEAQLDVQTLHRARERLVSKRTALINQMRALLLERGIGPNSTAALPYSTDRAVRISILARSSLRGRIRSRRLLKPDKVNTACRRGGPYVPTGCRDQVG